MIGFQHENYAFIEPQLNLPVVDQIFFEKEGGQISEQTFQVIVQVTNAASLRPATLDEDYRLSDALNVTSVTFTFPPDQQTIPFSFTLLADDLPEGLEAIGLRSMSGDNPFPDFGTPVSLFQTTTILIADDDSK